jgi:uncharacterized protein YabN with tetrapyrrole methylase and pyrophosphatase domain
VVKDKAKATEEFGDVLFTLINVARIAGIHPETALSLSTGKFVRRFKRMESMAAAKGRTVAEVSREQLEKFWQKAKKIEAMRDAADPQED